MARKPETWYRAFFSHGHACEAVENMVVECFNDMIKEIRNKPLLTMLEEIRILLMKRLWTVVPSDGDVFETRYGYNRYKVDLAACTCTCNLWMLSGIRFGPFIPRRDDAPPLVSESGDQVGGPAVSPMKRTKMMARRGGKTKVFGSMNKTPKKTPNALLTSLPYCRFMEKLRKQVLMKEMFRKEMFRKKRLKKERLRKNKLKRERVRKKKLKRERLRKKKLNAEWLRKKKLKREGGGGVGARVIPLGHGSYKFHWEKKRKPSERIRKLKLRKMIEDADDGGSSKTPWVLD
ncbi:unnamed protein product [Lactuca saligna]|uniref:Uncharacterized protein n=1 Tax=Lactuca saligna TaxID=75948 RepID=A0AA35ZCI0_LACSI|nr:unnamed protein product [Lactuca saligna]